MVGFSENGKSIEQVVLDPELRGFARPEILSLILINDKEALDGL